MILFLQNSLDHETRIIQMRPKASIIISLGRSCNSLPHAPCPMLPASFPLPHAPCPMLPALCSLPHAPCPMLPAPCLYSQIIIKTFLYQHSNNLTFAVHY